MKHLMMKLINEKIGYIDKHVFHLSNIVNTLMSFLTYDELKWSKKFTVNGKVNLKDKDGFLYKEFMFNMHSNKLGLVKVIIVNILDPEKESYKFDNFLADNDLAFYSPVDSIVNKGSRNCGYIYVNFNEFKDLKKDELKELLSEVIYHELRHYYDNILGVFSGNSFELSHITLIADELGLSKNEFKEKFRKQIQTDKSLVALRQILYVSQPTELNAWYHSFVLNMVTYAHKHPGLTNDDIKTYIGNKSLSKSNNEFFIYNGAFIYKDLKTYKKAINTLCGNDPLKLYYYLKSTLTNCEPSSKVLKALNNIFEEKYMDFLKDDITTESFITNMKKFFDDRYYEYVYKKISKPYLHTVKNMQKFLCTLVEDESSTKLKAKKRDNKL